MVKWDDAKLGGDFMPIREIEINGNSLQPTLT